MIEGVTEEGYAFRVDLRLRPEGRMGPVAMSLDAYRAYHRERAELWERQALLKARVGAGDPGVGARFMDFVREIVYRPGLDGRVRPAIRGMTREIGPALRGHRAVTRDVHRAFREFFGERPAAAAARPRLPSRIALAATGFSDPERALQNLRMIVEGRPLVPYPGALRAALTRLQPVLLDACWKSPDPDEALNQFERFLAAAGPRAGYVELLAARPELLAGLVRLCAGGDLLAQLLVAQPELLSSLADRSVLEGRRTRADFRAALAPVFAPGLGAAERRDRLRRIKQAQELTVVWRYLFGVTDVDRYSREMTALAEASLAAGWLMALGAQVVRYGVPRGARGRFIPAVVVGLGKLGGRELTTGSDLDLFVVFAADGETDGARRVDAHTFYSAAVERMAAALADITPAGVAFQVDLRLRPGRKGSGFASNVAALEHYYEEWGDLWER